MTIENLINLASLALAILGGVWTLNKQVIKLEAADRSHKDRYEEGLKTLSKDIENEIKLIRQELKSEHERVNVELRSQQSNLEHLNRAGENLKAQMIEFNGVNIKIMTLLNSLTDLVKEVQSDVKELQQKK